MNLILTPPLHGLTLFIWIVSLLTLSVSNEVKTDGTTILKASTSNGSYNDELSKSNDQVLSLAIAPEFETINSPKLPNKKITTPLVPGEGGPISITSTIKDVSPIVPHITSNIDNVNTQNNLPKEKDNTPVVLTKGSAVSKIVPRKGANQILLDTEKENVSSHDDTISSGEIKSVIHTSKETTDKQTIKVHISNDANNEKTNITDTLVKNKASNISINSSLHQTNVSNQNSWTSATIATVLIKEHKAKPTVTIAGPNNDKRILSSSGKGKRLGMSKKIDYVMPVIITLMALPVLGAIIFMIYKQGRDCWDKRHYRRMDFLIDGMYND